MASLNKCQLIGNLGRDPEIRYMPNGDAVANIAIATSYKPKDRDAITEWHRVVFFGRLAEVVGEYLKKGSSIYIEGRLQTRKYQKDGVDHYATEIVGESMQMLSKREDDSEQRQDRQPSQIQNREQAGDCQHQVSNAYANQKDNGRSAAPRAAPRPASDFSDMDENIPF